VRVVGLGQDADPVAVPLDLLAEVRVGRAVAGPLTGQRLEPAEYVDTFWFAWSAFQPGPAWSSAEPHPGAGSDRRTAAPKP
jgi:hypothetical protein